MGTLSTKILKIQIKLLQLKLNYLNARTLDAVNGRIEMQKKRLVSVKTK